MANKYITILFLQCPAKFGSFFLVFYYNYGSIKVRIHSQSVTEEKNKFYFDSTIFLDVMIKFSGRKGWELEAINPLIIALRP